MKKIIIIFNLLFFFLVANVMAKQVSSSEENQIDSNALQWIMAVDENEIALGQLAVSKNTSSAVNDYANKMIEDHGNNLKQASKLLDNLKSDSAHQGLADNIKKEGLHTKNYLQKFQNMEFEKKYMKVMVTGHKKTLQKIDHYLKKIHSGDIKEFLTSTRAAVSSHLQQAISIKDGLNNPAENKHAASH